MEYYQGRICLSYDDLTGGDDPVVKYNTLQSWLRRKVAIYARRAHGEGVIALIDYETLPTKAKQKIIELYGDPKELLTPKSEVSFLAEDFDAKRYFHYEYRYELNGQEVSLPEHIADEYELNARVLNALIQRYGVLMQMSNKLNNKRRNTWDLLQQYSEELRQDYAHTLPKSKSRLQRKLNEYKKQGYHCLISGKLGNSNTQKITAESGEYLVALMRSKDPVYTIEKAWQQYNEMAELNGWETIRSVTTVRDYLSDPAIEPLWYGVVVGESIANTKYGAQLTLQKPTYANSLWAADGTKLNLYYMDKSGKRATTDIYMIFDVCTGYIVGWALGEESAYGVQYPAFRRALKEAGVKPFELVMDNQSSQRKLDRVGFFSRITEVGVRFKTPYRKQANPAEHLIGLFQKDILAEYPYFTGFNVAGTKKETNRANQEWVSANLDSLPTEQNLPTLVAHCISEWNRRTARGEAHSREQLYKEVLVNPDRRALTQEDMVELFWEKRDRLSTFRQGGLSITINGQEYKYEAYTDEGKVDTAWRLENTLRQFGVKYDPMDPLQVAIYRIDGDEAWRFERYLYPAVTVAMAAEDRTATDEEQTRAFLEADREMRVARQARGMAIDIKHSQSEKYNYPRMLGASKGDNERAAEMARELSGQVKTELKVVSAKASLAKLKKVESKLDYDFTPISQAEIQNKLMDKL